MSEFFIAAGLTLAFIALYVWQNLRARKLDAERSLNWFWHQNGPECWMYVRRVPGTSHLAVAHPDDMVVVCGGHVCFEKADGGRPAYWHVEIASVRYGTPHIRMTFEFQASSLAYGKRLVEAVAPIQREVDALASVVASVPEVME